MIKNPYKGKFIVIEGIDGAGSTTQSLRMHQFLREAKLKSHLTKEPTNYLIGGLIRSWLTGDWSSSPVTLQLLFTADRAHHLEKEIIPMLKKGIHVVCDRYFFSTIAYGALDINDTEWLANVNKHVLIPDITFYLQISAKEGMRRMHEGRNSFELFEKEQQLNKVAIQYERLTKDFPYIISIKGENSEDEVYEDMKKILMRKIL